MATPSRTADLLLRVEAACTSGGGTKAVIERVLAALRSRIPYDGHVFALSDPVTGIPTAPHADVPNLPWPRLPELIRRRHLSAVLLAEMLAELGVTDTLHVPFVDRFGRWGFLELWRTSGSFTDDERTALERLGSPITAGLRACTARTFADPAEPLPAVGPAVVMLGPDLQVRAQTEAAGAALLQLLPPDEALPPIPAAAYNLGAALLATEAGVRVGEPWSRVHLGGHRWVTVRASRLGEDIAVAFEPSTPAERTDLLARAAGLSPRETEVLGLLGVGLESREIAGSLFLSEHTVNDHVKAILAKTGARTRQVLLARAIG